MTYIPTKFHSVLFAMGWDLDTIYDFYKEGGYIVEEMHPADGHVWLMPDGVTVRYPTYMAGLGL